MGNPRPSHKSEQPGKRCPPLGSTISPLPMAVYVVLNPLLPCLAGKKNVYPLLVRMFAQASLPDAPHSRSKHDNDRRRDRTSAVTVVQLAEELSRGGGVRLDHSPVDWSYSGGGAGGGNERLSLSSSALDTDARSRAVHHVDVASPSGHDDATTTTLLLRDDEGIDAAVVFDPRRCSSNSGATPVISTDTASAMTTSTGGQILLQPLLPPCGEGASSQEDWPSSQLGLLASSSTTSISAAVAKSTPPVGTPAAASGATAAGGGPAAAAPPPPSRNVYVSGLPPCFDSEELVELFRRFGPIVSARVFDPTGCGAGGHPQGGVVSSSSAGNQGGQLTPPLTRLGFVLFIDAYTAQRAVTAMDGHVIKVPPPPSHHACASNSQHFASGRGDNRTTTTTTFQAATPPTSGEEYRLHVKTARTRVAPNHSHPSGGSHHGVGATPAPAAATRPAVPPITAPSASSQRSSPPTTCTRAIPRPAVSSSLVATYPPFCLHPSSDRIDSSVSSMTASPPFALVSGSHHHAPQHIIVPFHSASDAASSNRHTHPGGSRGALPQPQRTTAYDLSPSVPATTTSGSKLHEEQLGFVASPLPPPPPRQFHFVPSTYSPAAASGLTQLPPHNGISDHTAFAMGSGRAHHHLLRLGSAFSNVSASATTSSGIGGPTPPMMLLSLPSQQHVVVAVDGAHHHSLVRGGFNPQPTASFVDHQYDRQSCGFVPPRASEATAAPYGAPAVVWPSTTMPSDGAPPMTATLDPVVPSMTTAAVSNQRVSVDMYGGLSRHGPSTHYADPAGTQNHHPHYSGAPHPPHDQGRGSGGGDVTNGSNGTAWPPVSSTQPAAGSCYYYYCPQEEVRTSTSRFSQAAPPAFFVQAGAGAPPSLAPSYYVFVPSS